MLLDLRIVDANVGVARPPSLAEPQMGQRRAIEIERIAGHHLVRRHRPIVVLEERLRHRRLRIGQLVMEAIGHTFEKIGLLVLESSDHISILHGAIAFAGPHGLAP